MENFTQSNNIAIVIPARYASVRLPGKPLIKILDKPIIEWVYEKALQSKFASKVIVATDDERIYNTVVEFGGIAKMTSSQHKSGSDRISEVILDFPEIDIVVNVQGDEPLLKPESIDSAIQMLLDNKTADVATLVREITEDAELNNPNVVKAVLDNSGNALYFSRSPIPYPRVKEGAKYFAHIGLYAYRKESLLKMTQMPQSMLEKAESLEQLRALQNGMKIFAAVVDYKPVGIDTHEDLQEFKRLAQALI